MFGAAAVRNKKLKQQKAAAAQGEKQRGPYIKPFGPRFDPSELPYFKYKRALSEAKELQKNISRAKKDKRRKQRREQASPGGPPACSVDPLQVVAAAAAVGHSRAQKLPTKGKLKASKRKELLSQVRLSISADIEQLEGEDGIYRASSSANVVLYVGLGMAAIGLVITFVGLGDKGFRTLELKLIGPCLVGCGVFFALLRVLFCTVPSCCRAFFRCFRGKSADHRALLQDKKNQSRTSFGANTGAPNSAFGADSRRVAPSRNEFPSTVVTLPPIHSKHNMVQQGGPTASDTELSQSFRQKTLENSGEELKQMSQQKKSSASSRSQQEGEVSRSKTAKPIKYDNYSSDSDDSSVFSLQENTDINVHSSPYKGSDDFYVDMGERKKSLTRSKAEESEVVLDASHLDEVKESR